MLLSLKSAENGGVTRAAAGLTPVMWMYVGMRRRARTAHVLIAAVVKSFPKPI